MLRLLSNSLLSLLSRLLLFLTVRPLSWNHSVDDTIKRNRARLGRVIDFFFPAKTTSNPEFPAYMLLQQFPTGVVLGFNHFSLGEIPRLAAACFRCYGARPLLFPVNSEAYLIFHDLKTYLDALGIELSPLVTPRIYKKSMESATAESEKDDIAKRRLEYDQKYLRRSADILDRNGIVLVAPSRTRRKTVFSSEDEFLGLKPVPPVLRLIAMNFERTYPKHGPIELVPVPIFPPPEPSRGLNLFRKYYFPVYFESFSLEDAKSPKFDYKFLKELASKLPKELSYPSD